LPNGGTFVGTESYFYKLNFLKKLALHLEKINLYDESIFIGGDYNIAPDDRDVYNEKIWHERVCCTAVERCHFQDLKNKGFFDVLDEFFDQTALKRPFTWWDYRRGSVDRNLGLRLDHFLVNERAIKTIQKVDIDCITRTFERPSDHAPVIIQTSNP
jgi:exodeoxyribonuclease-3